MQRNYKVIIGSKEYDVERNEEGKFIIPDQLRGLGTGLKPAVEEWILIRKPLSEKTISANVLKHGTGGINIDASRIGSDVINTHGGGDKMSGMKGKGNSGVGIYETHTGRFPANLVLSHNDDCEESCTESCAVAALDEQSGLGCGASAPVRKKLTPVTTHIENIKPHKSVGDDGASFRGDSGGASRFFYVAKASKKDRDEGLEELPDVQTGCLDGNIDLINARKVGANPEKPNEPRKNFHPTVKSTKLMEYLITLVTPPGGTVLDPFMGSGSTGKACMNLGFDFIGIEKDPEYFSIAEKRTKK